MTNEKDYQPMFEELTKLLNTNSEGWYFCLDQQSKLDDMQAIIRVMRLLTR